MTMKLRKIAVGWYATEDGKFAAIGDDPGDVPTKTMVGDADERGGIHVGMNTQREWQAVHDPEGKLRESHQAGTTLAWFDTLRDARAYLATTTTEQR